MQRNESGNNVHIKLTTMSITSMALVHLNDYLLLAMLAMEVSTSPAWGGTVGFITSPNPSNTTEGREGRQRRKRGREVLASFSASNPHTVLSGVVLLTTENYTSTWQQRKETS